MKAGDQQSTAAMDATPAVRAADADIARIIPVAVLAIAILPSAVVLPGRWNWWPSRLSQSREPAGCG